MTLDPNYQYNVHTHTPKERQKKNTLNHYKDPSQRQTTGTLTIEPNAQSSPT